MLLTICFLTPPYVVTHWMFVCAPKKIWHNLFLVFFIFRKGSMKAKEQLTASLKKTIHYKLVISNEKFIDSQKVLIAVE